jgi:hypothetical protein
MVRRKPTIEQIDATRRTQGAKEQMYAQMAKACVAAVIQREWDILVTFPYFVKFKDKTFPHGILVSKTPTTNVYKIKVRKLLDWLHEKGYSKFCTEDVMKSSRDFQYFLGKMERMMDVGINEGGSDE